MTNKNKKRYSTPLVIRKMQIKISVGYLFTPTEMARTNKFIIIKIQVNNKNKPW